MFLDEFQAGQSLGASQLNAIRDEIIRLGKVSAAPPLHVSDDAGGFRFDLAEPEYFTIKIVAGGAAGKYPWTKQYATAGGKWADDSIAGTMAADPAYESGGNASVATGTIILRAYRDLLTGELRFERGSC